MFPRFLHKVKKQQCNVTIIEEETSLIATPNHRYELNYPASFVTIQLPLSSCVGDVLEVVDIGGGKFKITQAEDQQIQCNDEVTTYGITGRIDSVDELVTIKLVCVIKDLAWNVDYFTQTLEVI